MEQRTQKEVNTDRKCSKWFPCQLENKKTNSLIKIGPKVGTGISPKKIHRMQTNTQLAAGAIKTRALVLLGGAERRLCRQAASQP